MIPLGIANSSPLIALGRIGRLELLEGCFKQLLFPESVAAEMGDLPSWIAVQAVAQPRALAGFPPRIHKGEAEVILLGLECSRAVLVLDDWYAREFARSCGLPVMGTIGLLLRCKRDGRLATLAPVLDQLTAAGFRLSPRVIVEAKRLATENS